MKTELKAVSGISTGGAIFNHKTFYDTFRPLDTLSEAERNEKMQIVQLKYAKANAALLGVKVDIIK